MEPHLHASVLASAAFQAFKDTITEISNRDTFGSSTEVVTKIFYKPSTDSTTAYHHGFVMQIRVDLHNKIETPSDSAVQEYSQTMERVLQEPTLGIAVVPDDARGGDLHPAAHRLAVALRKALPEVS